MVLATALYVFFVVVLCRIITRKFLVPLLETKEEAIVAAKTKELNVLKELEKKNNSKSDFVKLSLTRRKIITIEKDIKNLKKENNFVDNTLRATARRVLPFALPLLIVVCLWWNTVIFDVPEHHPLSPILALRGRENVSILLWAIVCSRVANSVYTALTGSIL